MVLGTKNAKNPPIWDTFYKSGSVPIFKHKKRKNVIELIASIGINGPSTTYEIAKFILSKGLSKSQAALIRGDELDKLAGYYNRLLTKRTTVDKNYPGLVPNGWIQQVWKKSGAKGKDVDVYFTSLKGSLLLLGFNLKDSELTTVIKIAACNSLFFAYINSILDKTSIKFVRKIFIKPFQEVIERAQVFQDHDIRFYFSNISERTAHALTQMMNLILKKYFAQDSENKISIYLKQSGIETLIDNTYYTDEPNEDWIDVMIETFYSNPDQEEFYRTNCDEFIDSQLLYMVMRAIHFTYHENLGLPVPRNPRKKLLRSKSWKEHQKFKKAKI